MLKPSGLNRPAVRAYFEQRAGEVRKGDDAFVVREAGRRLIERLEPIRLETVTQVLDVGCGDGAATMALARRFPGASVLGLDLVAARLPAVGAGADAHGSRLMRWARRLGARLGARLGDRTPGSEGPNPLVAWCVGDAHSLPLPSGSVDVVWMSMSPQWFDDPLTALSECHRVLRPGGLIAFAAPGPGSILELRDLTGEAWPVWQDMHDWGDAFVHAGFQAPVIESERITLDYAVGDTGDLDPVDLDPRTALHSAASRLGHDLAEWLPIAPMPDWSAQALAAVARKVGGEPGAPASLAIDIELVLGHAWVPSTKRRDDGLAPIRWMSHSTGSRQGR